MTGKSFRNIETENTKREGLCDVNYNIFIPVNARSF